MFMTTLKYLKSILRYAPDEGAFYWLVDNKHPKARKGMKAGRINALGRAQIGVNKKQIFTHKLVWLFETGKWPTDMLDHINGNPLDNRFCNLRLSNHILNGQNQRAHRPNNKSSHLLGVSWHKLNNKYIAKIKINGKPKHLGYFNTAEEAHAAYVTAKRILHPAGTL
jgi:hypothetical protein